MKIKRSPQTKNVDCSSYSTPKTTQCFLFDVKISSDVQKLPELWQFKVVITCTKTGGLTAKFLVGPRIVDRCKTAGLQQDPSNSWVACSQESTL